MKLRHNIVANYISHLYAAVIAIAMLPLYIKYLGAEAYGLVAFFAILQTWFLLLDLGIIAALSREVARFRGKGDTGNQLPQLLRVMECILVVLTALIGGFLAYVAENIAQSWLKIEILPVSEVIEAIRLMSVVMILRVFCELYRGVVVGFERMVWLACFNSSISTVRFILVIPLLITVSNGIRTFFLFQVGVSILEAIILARKAYSLLPSIQPLFIRCNWKPMTEVMRFSFGMALASFVWVSVSQSDKLLLSGMLSLGDYAWFSLSVLAATGVILLTTPIASALLPRLTSLHAAGNEVELLVLYRASTQWAGILAWTSAAVLASQAERVLWVWTGDAQIATSAASTLCLYALGNGLMTIGAFPYYLQFARGHLRMHLLGTGLFVLVLLPTLVWSVKQYGASGAAWTWFLVNSLYFIFWVPIAHKYCAPKLHAQWLFKDVAPIAFMAISAAFVCRWFPWSNHRILLGIELLLVSGVILACSTWGSSWMRGRATQLLRRSTPVP